MTNQLGLMAAAGITGLATLLVLIGCFLPMFSLDWTSPQSSETLSISLSIWNQKTCCCSYSNSDTEEAVCKQASDNEIDIGDHCGYKPRFRAMAAFLVMGLVVLMAGLAFHAAKLLSPKMVPLPGIVGPGVLCVAFLFLMISWAVAAGTFAKGCEYEVQGVKIKQKAFSEAGYEYGPQFGLVVTGWVLCLFALGASWFGNMMGPNTSTASGGSGAANAGGRGGFGGTGTVVAGGTTGRGGQPLEAPILSAIARTNPAAKNSLYGPASQGDDML